MPTTMPPPFADVAYGTDPRQRYDVYPAPQPGPRPVLIRNNCGGFLVGEKSSVDDAYIELFHEVGITIVSANNRFADTHEFPTPQLDAARVIQHARAHADDYAIDPTRIAMIGSSAGSGMALWCAYHPDLADPTSDDPVARQSSRLQAVIAIDSQTSYDERIVQTWFGGRWRDTTDPTSPVLVLNRRGRHDLAELVSAINYLDATSPPTMMGYLFDPVPLDLSAEMPEGHDWVHTPLFAVPLMEKARPLGVHVEVHQFGPMSDPTSVPRQRRTGRDFLVRQFGL